MSFIFGGSKTTTRAEKIASFQSTACEFGSPLPIAYGTCKMAPNLINYQDFTTIENRTTVKTGKHSSATTIDYDYYVYAELALSEGVIDGIGKIWIGNDVFENLQVFNGKNGQQGAPLSLNVGDNPNPTTYMATKHPDIAVGYKNMAYLYGKIFLGTNSASVPSYNFEIKGLHRLSGDGVDANPADVIIDLLSRIGYAEYIDKASFDDYRSYCRGFGLLISTPGGLFGGQKKCQEYVKGILNITNSYMFWSDDGFKIVPRDDRPRGSWRPNNVVRYDITTKDMQQQSNGACVNYARKDSSELYNRWGVVFTNRANNYEEETIFYEDTADIKKNGIRAAQSVDAKWFHTAERAVKLAEMLARINRTECIKYTFKLNWKFVCLEPGDLITLTDYAVGLDKQLCMIDSVTEDGSGLLTVTALRREAVVDEIKYNVPKHTYNQINFNAEPGNVNTPLFITPPSELTVAASGLEVWLAIQGKSEYWGGASVYVSTKDGAYSLYGVHNINSNYGKILTDMTADSTTVEVKFSNVGTVEMLEGSAADAKNGLTDLWINGECLAYTRSTLVAVNTYRLEGLLRGRYNTAPKPHAIGDDFARLDGSLYRVQLTKNYLGKTMYCKLPSFNTLKKSPQALNDVVFYTHTISLYDIPNVSNITAGVINAGIRGWNVEVTWTAPDWADYSQGRVCYKAKAAKEWSYVGVGVNSLLIKNIRTAGTYVVSVATKDTNGNHETPDASTQIEFVITEEVQS